MIYRGTCGEEMVGPSPSEGWLAVGFPPSISCDAPITVDWPDNWTASLPILVRCGRGHQRIVQLSELEQTDDQLEGEAS